MLTPSLMTEPLRSNFIRFSYRPWSQSSPSRRDIRLLGRSHKISATQVTIASIWLSYSTFIFLQALSAPPLLWQDSKSYASVSGHSLLSQNFWAGTLPPVTPLAIRLAGTGIIYILFQTSISVIAWGLLVVAIGGCLRSNSGKIMSTLLVLGFASSNPITLWNNSVLSETFDLSFLVMVIAGFIFLTTKMKRGRIVLVTMASLLFAGTRDTSIVTIGLISIGLVLLLLANRHFSFEVAKSWWTLVTLLACVVLICTVGLSISGRSGSTISDNYYVRVFPFPNRVAWFAGHGMPQATAIDKLSKSVKSTPGSAKVVFTQALPELQGLNDWIAMHGNSDYALWLITHPMYDVTAPFTRPELAFNFAQGNLNFYESPRRVNFFASSFFWPSFQEFLIFLIIAVGVSLRSRSFRNFSWQMLVMICVAGLLTMLFAWHGDGQETTRHTIEGYVEMRLGALLAFILTVFRSNDEFGQRRLK
jgi:hypothetical protein